MIATGASLDPIQLLLINAGTAGVVVVLILVGWLWAKPSVMREFEKSDTKDKQQQALIDTMLSVYHKEVLPTLADVDKRLVPLLESTSSLLKRIEVLLDRVEREWEWRERRGRVEETGFGSDERPRRDDAPRGRGGSGKGSGAGDYSSGEGRS